ncbi:multiple sugar transport system substrate-binding protein [Kitasatospora sp. MAA19]|uniref:ABC transporter substrate-binding protein n=1 Tax=unclassified Kitasatospora TaxID=2633591 RepID=UPI002476D30A|nr:sugar ABC transporter substrate-binding protein [Kitasatospora sp. MAA19]MDH6707226.1 multiple sugar transport system substrate-binding protein [Kitasatospora sp. MAA19]
MSAQTSQLSRRGFLGGSVLFVAGAAVGCTSNPTGGASGGAKTTLNVWSHAYGEAGTQQALTRYAAEFTKANPDIAVKVTWTPGDYAGKLNATLLTDAAPDVFEIGDFNDSLAWHGQIARLDDLYGSAKPDFNQGDLDTATVDGKLYGVKMIDDVMMLYYRKSALSKAGITPPDTFDALVAAAKALTTKNTKGLFLGNDGLGDSAIMAVWSNGGDLVADGKAVFGSPQAAEAVAGLKRLHDDQSLLLGFTTDWWDPAALVQNVVPMQWGGLWSMPAIRTALGDDFGVLPWPAYKPGGTPVVRVGGWTSCVNAKGKNVDAAKKFVQWLWIQQTDLQKDWSESYGFHIPPRKSVAASADKVAQGTAKETVELAAKYGRHNPGAWNSAVSSLFNAAAAKIVSGQGDASSLLADAARQAQSEIDKQRA